MRTSLPILFLLLSFVSFAQSDNPAGAPLVTLGNWSTGGTSYAGNLGATGSGYAVCAGSDVDDAWYRFTATTQAVKIAGTTTGFDMVIELWTLGPGASLACENASATYSGETLRYTGLTIGTQYLIRIHSTGTMSSSAFTVAVSFLPKAFIRSSYTPNPSGDDIVPGYKISNNTSRNIFTVGETATIQASRFKLEDSVTGDQFFSTASGTTGLKNLNDFGGLCYDKIYYAWVEVQIEGFWCGYSDMFPINMEQYPNTTMQAIYVGQTYTLDQFVKCNFVGDEQIIEWEFTTDNGASVLTHNAGTSSFCYFDEIDCFRYNKIYQVRIRVNYCGVWGPWSTPTFIITAPLPYVNVRPQYCDVWMYAGNTILCDFLEMVDQYGWQFAPMEFGDPEMVPTGPAIVTYTPTTACYLLPLGLEIGTTYRAGVKPFVGVNDNCDDPQEGDYGFFCPIHIIDPGNPPATGDQVSMELPDVTEIEQQESEAKVFRTAGGDFLISLDGRSSIIAGNVLMEVYGLNGQLMARQRYTGVESNPILQMMTPGDLASGIYILKVTSGTDVVATRFWIP